mgnify:CR=1 FL=1
MLAGTLKLEKLKKEKNTLDLKESTCLERINKLREFIAWLKRHWREESRIATEMLLAPSTKCAFVTTIPSARTMKPEPSPGVMRRPPCPPPKNQSNGSTGARETISVCTVTTAGETLAIASVGSEATAQVPRPGIDRLQLRSPGAGGPLVPLAARAAAYGKLRAMVEGAAIVRRELGA